MFPTSGTWAQNSDWQVQEGLLLQNGALYSSMVQDSFGVIWIGGEDGLRYYDGNILSEKLLEGKNIRLALSRNKVLFAFDDSGSIWMQNRKYAFRLEKFDIPATFVSGYPLSVEILDNGAFCLLDKYAGILIWNGKEQHSWAHPNAEYSGLCYTNSAIWVSGDEGLWYCTDHGSKPEFKQVSGPAAPADHIITAIQKQGLNGIWAITYSGEVLAYQLQNKIPLKTKSFLVQGIPQKISDSESGLLIEISEGGIVKLEHEKGRSVQVYSGAMVASLIDREGNLFIVKRDGSLLKTWVPLRKLNFKTSEIRSVIQSKILGTVVAAESGVWYLSDTTWTCLKGTENVVATCFAEDESGRLWIGSFDKGLFCLDKGKLYQFGTEQGLGDNNVLTLCSRNGELWISTFSGIDHLVGPTNAAKITAPISGFSGHFAYSLLYDSQGVLWIGTDGAGLYSWKNSKLKAYDDPFKGSQIYDLAEDNKQQIWVATADLGFWIIRNDEKPQLKIPVTAQALHIHHLDEGNMLAFSGDKMILYYSTVDQYVVLGKNSGTFPGPPDIKALYNNKHEVCLGVDGVPYLLKLPDNPDWLTPRLQFYATDINGIPYQQFPAKLASDENILRIQFQAFWYRNPAYLVYRYRLNGIDTNWQLTKDDALYFGKLPSGGYLLDFEVAVNDGFQLPAKQQIEFERAAPLYARTWFIVGVVLLFSGIIIGFLQLRIRRITRLEKLERDKLAFQLETLRDQVNPHFIFNSFNTLQGLIDTNSKNATAYLEKLAKFFRNLLLLRNKNSITLREELELLENYEALQRERFGEKFVVYRNILPEALDFYIAPLTLQILLENALKHNVLNKKDPLPIHIETPDPFHVRVRNPIRVKIRSQNESTVTGLKNIQDRSILRTGKKIDIVNGPDAFMVQVPLSKDP
ncbi:MAG: sensor histidine kinase [Bacteroidia bacterium]